MACGAALAPSAAPAEAERRQLTVLFCDLVGSTTLSEQLDPEDLRDVVRTYQAACAAIVADLDGYVAQYLGDGILVYFGYPRAHEDAAERAVRAGLRMASAVPAMRLPILERRRLGLTVRIGVHTGLVVVGAMGAGGREERLALGDTPNVAARVQGLAAPGSVVITDATRRLLREPFPLRDRGVPDLKGVSAPVRVFDVLGEPSLAGAGRQDTGHDRAFVGRAAELAWLLEQWAEARPGAGRMIVVQGEAGIGKSQLLHALRARLVGTTHRVLWSRCSAYHSSTPMHPIIDMLPRLLGWQPEDDAGARLLKLERAVALCDLKLAETVPLLAALLSLPADDRYPARPLSAQRQRQLTEQALVASVRALARHTPLLFVVEDLHWVDPSTVALLGRILDGVPDVALLAIVSARPEWSVPWAPRPQLAHLALDRFAPSDTAALIERVAGCRLPDEVVAHVTAQTDGVPLFVEELTRTLLESGRLERHGAEFRLRAPLSTLAIPATLHDSLMARLDRLGPARDVVQLGAIVGRAFSWELVRAASDHDDATLADALARAVDSDLVNQRGAPPAATYAFRHALIRDTAYQSLVRSTRERAHRRIATALVERFPAQAESEPEVVAHHFAEAGAAELAITYWQRAGQRALARSALTEARAHLTRGLALLADLPASPATAQLELDLLTVLGPAEMAIQGFVAPDAARVYGRAQELSQHVEATPKLVWALEGLWAFHLVGGRYDVARELGERILEVATRLDRPQYHVVADQTLGMTLFYLGGFTAALTHLERGVAAHAGGGARGRGATGLHDAGVGCRGFAALARTVVGDTGRAAALTTALLAHVADAHPWDVTLAQLACAVGAQCRGDAATARTHAATAVAVAGEHGFPMWLMQARVLHGWAVAVTTAPADGIAELRRALTGWAATGADNLRPYFLTLLADACRAAGAGADGLQAAHQALALLEKTGERWCEAEAFRVHGELLAAAGHAADAVHSFDRAIAVARAQGAGPWEARAAAGRERVAMR
jgi:class 3 adenylate cyclase/tetratricopeptide (TPR) repeat protein/ABC-type transport system involved in cytochrome c biogenesis ATPase subunit